MEENDKIVEKTYTDPVTGKFVKGNPGGGRPNGSLDFKTKFYKVIDKLAKQNDITPEEVEEQLLLVGYKKAKDGDYSFYRDLMDRIHGKPLQSTDITSKGNEIKGNNIIFKDFNTDELNEDETDS